MSTPPEPPPAAITTSNSFQAPTLDTEKVDVPTVVKEWTL
jgi:hypothetical protein